MYVYAVDSKIENEPSHGGDSDMGESSHVEDSDMMGDSSHVEDSDIGTSSHGEDSDIGTSSHVEDSDIEKICSYEMPLTLSIQQPQTPLNAVVSPVTAATPQEAEPTHQREENSSSSQIQLQLEECYVIGGVCTRIGCSTCEFD